MSTDPTTKSATDPAALEKEAKAILTAPWFVHDVLLYAGSYLTLWLAAVPAGGGWDAAIAAAPVSLSALLRPLLGAVK